MALSRPQIFAMRVTADEQQRLAAEAARLGVSKSDLARRRLADVLQNEEAPDRDVEGFRNSRRTTNVGPSYRSTGRDQRPAA